MKNIYLHELLTIIVIQYKGNNWCVVLLRDAVCQL